MKVFNALTRSQRRSLSLLFAAGLFFWSSMASLLPTLPLYVKHVGGTEQQIGFVMGSFALGLVLSRPTLGRWADSHSRTFVLRVGTVVVAIAPLGYLLVSSIPGLMALRTFHGISIAAFTTAYSALVADLSPPQQRGELIGYMTLVTPLGVGLGPALGGFVQADLGYPALFLTTSALGVVSGLCGWQLAEPTSFEEDMAAQPPFETSRSPSEATPEPKPEATFWQLLASPRVLVPTMVMSVVGLIFGTLTTFVPLHIEASAIALNPGWFYTATAIASFSMRLVAGQASDRFGRGLFISSALVCYALSMLTLSVADRSELFLLAGFVEGMAAGVLIPTTIALMTDRSAPQERGRVFSLCVGGFDLGIAIAGPLLGSIAQYLSYGALFAISSGLAVFALVVFVTRNSKDFPHSVRFALGRERDLYAIEMPSPR
ncbi:quinolene resistance protein NorA [Geitlerinema sp. FC II]|nr:MFS transporter [Geitlerinema sp. CS-897]PPT06605.1 quinolene resistance protein NorA [Geitlerinema sp. FC II]